MKFLEITPHKKLHHHNVRSSVTGFKMFNIFLAIFQWFFCLRWVFLPGKPMYTFTKEFGPQSPKSHGHNDMGIFRFGRNWLKFRWSHWDQSKNVQDQSKQGISKLRWSHWDQSENNKLNQTVIYFANILNWRQHSKKLPPVRSEFGFLDDFLVLHFPLNHILVAKSNDDALAIPHRHHPLLLLVTKPNEQLIIKDISTSQVSTTLWTLLSPVGFSSTNRTSVRMNTCYYTMR